MLCERKGNYQIVSVQKLRFEQKEVKNFRNTSEIKKKKKNTKADAQMTSQLNSSRLLQIWNAEIIPT